MVSDMFTLDDIAKKLSAGQELGRAEGLWLARSAEFEELLSLADKLRTKSFGNAVSVCAIINAKSGACSEDCKFCAQSARHRTGAPVYPLVSKEGMVAAAHNAARAGADRFGIVTSGETACTSRKDFETICAAAKEIRESGVIGVCVSIGKLNAAEVQQLKAAGVTRIHHNLETSERFYLHVCTTHSYNDRIDTVRNIKAAGLELCSGGIFGLGETLEDRVDLALQLREIGAHAAPLNFLTPVPGTPLENQPLLPPREALRMIALCRLMLPGTEIRICGGRTVTLRDMQSWMFRAGASGLMTGNYLTTAGRSPQDDLRMLDDLGLTPQYKRSKRQDPNGK